MYKTVVSPTSAKISTVSFWMKAIGVTDKGIFAARTDTNNRHSIYWEGGGGAKLELWGKRSGSTIVEMHLTRAFRDPSAWIHNVIAIDTTQATAGNRVKWYVNGVQQTVFTTETQATEDSSLEWSVADATLAVGAYAATSGFSSYFDGYLAEFVFIDGTQYAASDFGEFDEDSPTIWKPKKVSTLTFGNNGFYLDFKDSANLGNDANGGTDLSENNIAATDQATDTPTNNFCVMNPLDNYRFAGTFSEGNCHVVSSSSNYAYTTGTMGMTAGKYYWEVEFDAQSSSGDYSRIGFAGVMSTGNAELGSQTHNYAYYGVNGNGYYNGSNADLGTTYTVGDIISVALDLDNLKVYYAKNGTWVNSGDPTSGATGTGAQTVLAASTTTIGAYLPALNYVDSSITGTWKCNFGGCSAFTVSSANSDGNGYGNFEYAVPSGYLALCTKNLGSDGG